MLRVYVLLLVSSAAGALQGHVPITQSRVTAMRHSLTMADTQISTTHRRRRKRPFTARRAAASVAEDDAVAVRGGRWIQYRTSLLFAALVAQKVVTDLLTGWTRSQTVYSGATVSMLSEVAKFPVLMAAICLFGGEGWKRVPRTFKHALTKGPLDVSWIAGAYAAQNVLYFAALSRISAASYQVLSQSKLIFTAILTVTLLGKSLNLRQISALTTLLVGSLFVQVSEMSGAATGGFFAATTKATALYGGFLTVLGALLAALPNVAYEKLLKTKGEDEWVRNVQVTVWIMLWIAFGQIGATAQSTGGLFVGEGPLTSPVNFLKSLFGGGHPFAGMTPAVWLVVFLKSLNGILIPLTLKYASNLIYLYAKPTSIVRFPFMFLLLVFSSRSQPPSSPQSILVPSHHPHSPSVEPSSSPPCLPTRIIIKNNPFFLSFRRQPSPTKIEERQPLSSSSRHPLTKNIFLLTTRLSTLNSTHSHPSSL